MGSLVFFVVGEFVLVALAVALPNWRHLSIAAGGINAAALLLYPFIPESARWLLSQGRQQEAVAILQAVSVRNKSCMPTGPLICSRDYVPKQPIQQQQPQGQTDSSHATAVVTISRKESTAQPAKCVKNVDVESLELELSAASDRSLGSARAAAAAGDICPVNSRFGQSTTSTAAADGASQPMSFLQLLKTPKLLIRSGVLVVTWFSLLLAYYGITLGAGGIPGSV